MKRIIVLLVGIAALVAAIVFLSIRGVSAQGTYPTTTPWYVTATPVQTSNGPVVIPYGSTPIPTTSMQTVAIVRKAEVFHTPVQCTTKFNDESSWLICEKGVLLDNSTVWTIPGTQQVWYVNVPEGGFTYFSMAGGDITMNGVTISLKFEKGLNYLVLIRGRIDDNIVDSDLNITAQVSGFVPGHAIWAHMPTGAYVSKDWFRQQLVASSTKGYTNCGATGCSRVRIVLFDVDSHFFQEFETRAGAIDTWTLIASN